MDDINPARPSWLDLFLYLFLGFGLFLVAGLALRGYVRNPSILASAIIYSTNVVIFSGTVLLVGVLRGKLSLAEIGFIPARWDWRWLSWAVAILLVFYPIRIGLAVLIEYAVRGNLNGLAQTPRTQIFAPDGFTWVSFAVTFVMAGIAAPIAEELFFRGALFTWFRQRFSLWPSILASSTLFALGHADTLAVVITSFILGVVNAWVFERTRSIWASIAIHAVNNSVAVVLVYAALAFGRGK